MWIGRGLSTDGCCVSALQAILWTHGTGSNFDHEHGPADRSGGRNALLSLQAHAVIMKNGRAGVFTGPGGQSDKEFVKGVKSRGTASTATLQLV